MPAVDHRGQIVSINRAAADLLRVDPEQVQGHNIEGVPEVDIQQFVHRTLETGGGIDDPRQIERYLGIIAKHSNRLNAIIGDLLSLSRLEEDQERRRLQISQNHSPTAMLI